MPGRADARPGPATTAKTPALPPPARIMDRVGTLLDPYRKVDKLTAAGALSTDPIPLERIVGDLQALLANGVSAESVAQSLSPIVAVVRRQALDIDQLSASVRDLAEEIVSLRRERTQPMT